jgi:hypothetical protein
MTNQDLITKLNSLKKVSPEASWLASNRELLLSQISNSGAAQLPTWKVFIINLQSVMKAASRPVYALGVFVFVLISASLFSHQIFAKTKPNDSLYIARIVSEKMRLNTVLNHQDRDKMAVQFASEHAQEITEVLADPEFNTEANSVQVAKLNDSFNQEVENVKSGISRLTPAVDKSEVEDDIIIADSSKDDQGMQISNPDQGEKSNSVATSSATEDASTLNARISSSTELSTNEELAGVTATSTAPATSETEKILDEAKDLFSKKDYNSALNKLKEVEEIMK